MRIRIEQKYLGDMYIYYVTLINMSKQCIVDRHVKTDNMQATISDDFKTIPFNKGGFEISGLFGEKPKTITYLKVPKHHLRNIKENFETP